MARDDEDVAPPTRLRPFLKFATYDATVLAIVRRVLEEDEAFRKRVAEQADEAELGADAWLFLQRPQGWEERLRARVEESSSRTDAARDAQTERRAVKRLEATEEKLARVRSELAAAKADAADARREAVEARRARAATEGELEAATTASISALAARDGERRRAETAEAAVARLQREVAAHAVVTPVVEDPAPVIAPLPPEPMPAPAIGPELAKGVRAAASAAADLAAALARVAEVMGGTEVEVSPEGDQAPEPTTTERAARARRPRRVPLAPPPATMADSVEAAAHLVRVSGVLVVVDGYNVSKLAWPELPPVEQRDRLESALEGLRARARCEVHVVWDGAEGNEPSRGAVARRIRTSFSPPDVIADEVIVSMARDLPPEQSVVVVSNDREVRDRTEAWGANVVSSDHLLELLSRR